ncbi:4Fe-4S dicluster domain-containing protein [bacterium]|nr:4Fe-4S dicluster domain-containing protein [bacterium]
MSPIESDAENKYWRSQGQLENSPEFKEFVDREFPKDASVLDDDVSRRTFIKIMGASFAFAGLTGCAGIRRPKQTIRPYARMPENLIPGRPNFYATTMAIGSDVVGLLVESHEGRPTKIEGNPSHPGSLGSTNAIHQASVLELYDPDRLKSVTTHIPSGDPDTYGDWLSTQVQSMKDTQGTGVAVLVENHASPTLNRLLDDFSKKYPNASIYQFSPINDDAAIEGIQAITGKRLRVSVDYAKLDRVVSFGCDFLGTEPNNVRASKEFASRRDPDVEAGMNRLYMVESHFTITGGKADHRIRIQPGQFDTAIAQLASAIFKATPGAPAPLVAKARAIAKKGGDILPEAFLNAIIDDLTSKNHNGGVVVGSQVSPFAHSMAVAINQVIGANNLTIRYYPVHFSESKYTTVGSTESIQALVNAIHGGDITTLFILGGNPVFNSGSESGFTDALSKLKHSLHLTQSANETSHHVQWVAPKTHYLEAWGDSQTIDGVTSIVQPLITPLYTGSVSEIEFISRLINDADVSGYDEVRTTLSAASNEKGWRRWLHEGIVTNSPADAISIALGSSTASERSIHGLQVEFTPDFKVYDGRFTNVGWLQELPHPVTKLTWDNAALIGVDTAKKLHVKTGDLIKISVGKHVLDIAVMVQPGTADDTIVIPMGYGRTIDGRIGQGTGFNAYALRPTSSTSVIGGATIQKLSKTYTLATTQEHSSMEGRPLIKEATLTEYDENPEFAKESEHEGPPMKSSWPERTYDTGNQWGMSIDLSKCTGCNACLVACQSENNIPIVGKSQVANGREMHWIRLDRYFEGPENDPNMVQQPMTCLQCENAPCEQVCPVNATVHSHEGLNDMVYNRCIGTKYCSNNCPVKVRRFNFFDFHQRNPQAIAKKREHFFDYFKEPDKTVQMQFNPDVTIRMRGVMEKCTYCVQRISQARIRSKNEGREIVDGEIKSACMQVCPSDAIVFGNTLDPNSKVAKAKKNPRDYHILHELYLKARTTYLAGVRNPHPKLVEEKA